METIIPRNIRLAEAPSYGKPALLYDVRSRGAESYIRLAKEIMQRSLQSRDATHQRAHTEDFSDVNELKRVNES